MCTTAAFCTGHDISNRKPSWGPMLHQPKVNLYDYTLESISKIPSNPNSIISPTALSSHRSDLALDPFPATPFSPSSLVPMKVSSSSLTQLKSFRNGHSHVGGANRNIASIAAGPAALLGGSAIMYKIALASPNAGLSPLATMYMFLLAFQYGLQPRVSKRYIKPETNKKSVALVEEIVKTAISAVIFLGSGGDHKRKVLQGWSLSSSLLVAGLPAALYAIQGVCQYIAYQNLDSVSFNGLAQTKMLSAAFFCFLLMGKKQSLFQIVALALLSMSALIFQGTLSIPSLLSKISSLTSTNGSVAINVLKPKASSTSKKNQDVSDNRENTLRKKHRFTHGVVPCLAATLLSGFAGALSQKGLQLYGGNGRDPYLYTIEVSFFSAVCLLASVVFGKKDGMSGDVQEHQTLKNRGYFAHWTWGTLIPIFIKALGGLLTALVHKYAGSVLKGFALILGLVFSGVTQTLLDDKQLSSEQIVGTLLVMLSSWMHFSHPPSP